MPSEDGPGELVPNSEISGTDKKRKRKALSCYECRKRKLRCDRDTPCARCLKAGHPETCVYNPEVLPLNADIVHEDPSLNLQQPQRSDFNGWHSRDKAERHLLGGGQVPGHIETILSSLRSHNAEIEQLKSRLANWTAQCQPPQRQEHAYTTSITKSPVFPQREQEEEPETMFFKGKAFRTQFYGASNATSILAHVSILTLSFVVILIRLVSSNPVVRIQCYQEPYRLHSYTK